MWGGGNKRSEIGFVREYLGMYHHYILKSGPIAMPSGVWPGRLCVNVPCAP